MSLNRPTPTMKDTVRWGCSVFLITFFIGSTSSNISVHLLHVDQPHNTSTEIFNQNWHSFEQKDFPLIFTCASGNPTQWKFTGLDNNLNWSGARLRKTVKYSSSNQKDFQFLNEFTISTFEEYLIGRYACSSLDKSENLEFYTFSASIPPFYLNRGQTLQVKPAQFEHPIVIPCPTSAPSETFYLQNLRGWRPRRDDAIFEPNRGFLIDTIKLPNYEGSYRCVQEGLEDDEANFVTVNVIRPVDYYVKPATELITINYKAGEVLKVQCSAIDEIKLRLDNNGLRNSRVTYQTSPELFYKYTAILEYHDIRPQEVGSVECLRSSNGRVIQTWKYSTYEEDIDLSISSGRNEMVCKSNSEYIVTIEATTCESLTECDHVAIQTGGNLAKLCGTGSVKLTLPKRGGYTITCSREGPGDQRNITRNIFVGLDNIIYDMNTDIPDIAILSIEDSTQSGNIGEDLRATCRWSSFLLSHSAKWVLTQADGTTINGGEGVVTSNEDGSWTSTFEQKKLIHTLSSISCHVFQWNISQWKGVSQSLDYDSPMASDLYCSTNKGQLANPTLTSTDIWNCPYESMDDTTKILGALVCSLAIIGSVVVVQTIWKTVHRMLLRIRIGEPVIGTPFAIQKAKDEGDAANDLIRLGQSEGSSASGWVRLGQGEGAAAND